jgi:hypothetical protein
VFRSPMSPESFLGTSRDRQQSTSAVPQSNLAAG